MDSLKECPKQRERTHPLPPQKKTTAAGEERIVLCRMKKGGHKLMNADVKYRPKEMSLK